MVMKCVPSLITNVLALAHNSEAGLFERLYRPEMINAGNFRHR